MVLFNLLLGRDKWGLYLSQVNIIWWLEFELAFYDVTVQHINYFASRIPQQENDDHPSRQRLEYVNFILSKRVGTLSLKKNEVPKDDTKLHGGEVLLLVLFKSTKADVKNSQGVK